MRSFAYLVALFGFCAFGLLMPIKAFAADNITTSQIVRQFDDVVFGAEHGKRNEIIRRWETAPSLAVFASPAADDRPPIARIDAQLGEIGALTGLEIKRTSNTADASLRLGFFPRRDFAALPAANTNDPDYNRFIRTSACLGIARSGTQSVGAIENGIILVGIDIAKSLQEHCLLEELVQMMGLSNDACNYQPSLFCEADHVMEMTRPDRILLKSLYDARLKSGMKREQAMQIVHTIVAELIYSASNESESSGRGF